MAENKKSFVLYCDLIHTVRKMPKDKIADLFLHILAYVNDENPVTEDIIIELTFEPIKWQLKRDLDKYERVVERNRNNGKNGGRPKKEPKKPTGLNGNPKNPVKPKKADNDNVTDIYIRPLSEIDISDVEPDLVDYFKIALEFQRLFILNLKSVNAPTATQEKATFKNYVTPIRLMMQNNEATRDDLIDVWKYLDSNEGYFWKKNILSTSKLREQFPKLIMSAREIKNKKSKQEERV